MPDGQPAKKRTVASWSEAALLYLIFAGTGVGMALPGAVLPTLMHEWAMRDGGAGGLFFLAWVGSSTGALLAGQYRRAVVALGCAAVGVALVAIAFGSAWIRFEAMFLFGLGLGSTMTAISLMRAARHKRDGAREMNRLNMVWAAGAVACPLLAAHSLRVASVQQICATLAGVFLALSGVVLLSAALGASADTLAQQEPRKRPREGRWIQARMMWPLPLLLLAFLPTGIESTMGGWVAEYARREHQSITTAVLAGSLFWGGILASRALASTRYLSWRTERGLLLQSAWTIMAGLVMLVAAPVQAGILCGNALVGFGLGPVYPLALAFALRHREQAGIFWVAGLGSASLPWWTGLASAAGGSLRLGMLVPLAASVVLLASGMAVARNRDGEGLGRNILNGRRV